MGASPSDNVDAKLAWAKHHFEILDGEIQSWLNDEGHRIIYERNEDFTQHYLRGQFGTQPSLERWSLMIGDCVTNLRDTLDHLIYGIAQLPGNPNPAKAAKAAFVITQSEEDFRNAAKSKLASVPASVSDAVRRLQPFNRPNLPLPPLIGILAELANGTKHKLLSVVFTVPQMMDIEFESHSQPYPFPAEMAINKRGILEGYPFVIFEMAAPDPNCQLKGANIRFNIAISHSPRPGSVAYDAGHTPYDALLRLLFDEVENAIKTIRAVV